MPLTLVHDDAATMRKDIKAPHVQASYDTLGGKERPSITITVSLDERGDWANGILHNSRYTMFHLGYDGVLEQFAVCYRLPKKFRKSRVTSVGQAIEKINKYLDDVRSMSDANANGQG